jgi:hypothetical protein
MNLVIKGADFSSVAIGKVDMNLKPSAGLLGEMLSATDGKLEFIDLPVDYLVNVFALPQYATKLNITAKGSSTRKSYSFCKGTMPTTTGGLPVTQDATSTSNFNSGIAVLESVGTGSSAVATFNDVDVPSEATFIMVYFGTSPEEKGQCKVEVVL